jgi:putative transposase
MSGVHAGKSLKGEDVVRVMEALRVLDKRLPARIQTDNGSEFISKSLDKWAYEHGVTIDFSRPGKPTDNAFIESFNGSLRDECLTFTGSCHWKMRRTNSTTGAGNTIMRERIHH